MASGLLLVMAALLLGTHLVPAPGFWVRLLRAASEAALVGGLADWFAVTALFRRPLGLPIPHTAIVPRNKDRIGANLGSFVERNFLAPELVAAKLRSLDIAGYAAAWLAAEANAHGLAERAAAALPYALEALDDSEVRGLLRQAVERRLADADLAPLLGKAIAALSETGQHQQIFDRGMAFLARFLGEHERQIYAMVAERSRWWIPKAIDERVARSIVGGARDFLHELADPEHEARRRLDEAVATFAQELQHETHHREKVEAVKRQLLGNSSVQAAIGSAVDELRRALVADVTAPTSATKQVLARSLRSLGETLAADDRLRARVNRWLERFVVRYVVPKRSEIGRFIEEVVRGWDSRTIAERIELAVGSDLQYIRMNGTLVGALVGCLLFLASQLAF